MPSVVHFDHLVSDVSVWGFFLIMNSKRSKKSAPQSILFLFSRPSVVFAVDANELYTSSILSMHAFVGAVLWLEKKEGNNNLTLRVQTRNAVQIADNTKEHSSKTRLIQKQLDLDSFQKMPVIAQLEPTTDSLDHFDVAV
jgi:hypothetical protein